MKNKPTLILVRHGNTFESGQQAVWVGARTDLPLTSRGEMQAQMAIRYIGQKYPWVKAITAGPLRRTMTSAAIMAAHLGAEFTTDRRLCEIDYGKWEGLTNAQIVERYGATTLEQWEQFGVWPSDMNWQPSPATLKSYLQEVLDEQHEKLKVGPVSRVIVTSNGIMRILHEMITGHPGGVDTKVKTGSLCALEPTETGWDIAGWDIAPV